MENEIRNKKIKIILMETDEDLGKLLSNFFHAKNFITYICKNSFELVNFINLCKPDIVIIDGYENIPEYELITIYLPRILLTTRGLKNDRIEAYKIGFDSYIVKPFDPDELIAIILNLIDKKRNFKELKFIKYRLNILTKKIKHRGNIISYKNLTVKEKEVFRLIKSGLNNKQIAKTMLITPRSVEKHATRIFEKLKIKNRLQILTYYQY